jgi:hypothetical protein
MNRDTAISYLNSLDRVYVFDGFANWDPEVRTASTAGSSSNSTATKCIKSEQAAAGIVRNFSNKSAKRLQKAAAAYC